MFQSRPECRPSGCPRRCPRARPRARPPRRRRAARRACAPRGAAHRAARTRPRSPCPRTGGSWSGGTRRLECTRGPTYSSHRSKSRQTGWYKSGHWALGTASRPPAGLEVGNPAHWCRLVAYHPGWSSSCCCCCCRCCCCNPRRVSLFFNCQWLFFSLLANGF